MDTVTEFRSKKYIVQKNILNEEMTSFISQYAIFDEISNPLINDGQVFNAHAKYADPAMETMLLMLQPAIERITGLSLFPTYSYYRVYRNGSILEKHIDRESCEISATVSFGYSYDGESWPIYMDGNPILLNPGDIAVYRGCEVQHWREKLNCNNSDWHVQGFFHYVDSNGPFTAFKFDNRESIGLPKHSNITKKYIQFIK